MTEDLTRGNTEDAGADIESAQSQGFTGAEGAAQLIGQGSVMIGRPAAGETVEISAESGETYVLDFDPSQARALVEGDNLILVFEDGSQIVFENLVNLAQLENGPGLQYAGEDMIALLQAQGIIPSELEGYELLQPEAGQIILIQAELGQRFIINFDPALAVVTVDGDNLVMTFPDGGQIVIAGIGALADDPNAPVFAIAGADIPGSTLMAAAGALGDEAGPDATATLETAAGAEGPEGTGETVYREDTGDTIDLLIAQPVIPPVEGGSKLIDLEVIDPEFIVDTPPDADPVTTPADTPDEETGIPGALETALGEAGLGGGGGGATTTMNFDAGSGSPTSYTEGAMKVSVISDLSSHLHLGGGDLFAHTTPSDAYEFELNEGGTFNLVSFDITSDGGGATFFALVDGVVVGSFVVPEGTGTVVVSDFSGDFTNITSVQWLLSPSSSMTLDNFVYSTGGAEIAFFKEITVDGDIGDGDSPFADMGGADNETALGDLVFTYNGDINIGTLVLDPGDGSPATVMSGGETYTNADTIWWVLTEADASAIEGTIPDATFTYTVTDEDGNTATAPVVITINDEPSVGEPESTLVDEDGEVEGSGSTAGLPGSNPGGPGDAPSDAGVIDTGNLDYDFGGDGPGDVSFADLDGEPVVDKDGADVTSNDNALEWSWDGATHKLTAVTVGESPETVLTLEVTDVATGDYKVTLHDVLDHPETDQDGDNDGPETAWEDDIVFALDFVVTDSDGDEANGTVEVTVDDDSPEITDGLDGALQGTVDEADLVTTATTSGDFFSEVSFGADGEGNLESITIGGTTLDVSGDDQVFTSADFGGTPGQWTLTVNEGGDEGTYTFELLQSVTHGDPEKTGSQDTVDLPTITASVSDGDEDAIDVTLDIKVEDDGPAASYEASEGSVTIDETAGLQDDATTPTDVDRGPSSDPDNDDVAANAGFAGSTVAAAFDNEVTDKGTDADFGDTQYALSGGSLVQETEIPGNDFGADDAAISNSVSYGLSVKDADTPVTLSNPEVLALKTDLMATDSDLPIYLVEEDGVIVGRLGEEQFEQAELVSVTLGDAVFAVSIDSATGEVAVAQFMALEQTDSNDHDSVVDLAGESSYLTVDVTIEDGDGDTSTDSVDVGTQIRFEDDGPVAVSDVDQVQVGETTSGNVITGLEGDNAEITLTDPIDPNVDEDYTVTVNGQLVTLTVGNGDVFDTAAAVATELAGLIFAATGLTVNVTDGTMTIVEAGAGSNLSVVIGTTDNMSLDPEGNHSDALAADDGGADGVALIRSIVHDGVTYVVMQDDEDNFYVKAGSESDPQQEFDDPADGWSFNATTGVLTIEVTAAGGSITIDLLGADIGEYVYTAPVSDPSESSEEFTYVLEDGDGDTDDATLTINLDDGPSAETPDTVTHDESSGNQDNPPETNDPDDDAIDIAVDGTLEGDAEAAAGGVTLTGIGQVDRTLSFDVGLDDGANASVKLDAAVADTAVTGLVMTESGKAVYYFVPNATGNLVLGVTLTDAALADLANVLTGGIDTTEIEDVVFSMHLSTTDPTAGSATYSFIQYEAVAHDTDGDGTGVPNEHDDPLTSLISIDYIVTDQDGDTASATITTDIEDDGPSLVAETSSTDTVEEEHGLAGGNEDVTGTGDADTEGNFNLTTNLGTGSLSTLVDFGADGGGFGLTVIANNDPVDSTLKSGTATVWYVSDGTTLTAFLDDGDTPGTYVNGSDTDVFTLTLSGANNADWDFTLLHQLDHEGTNPGVEDTLTIDFSHLIVATDGDGDTVDLSADSFTVDVIDDIPIAVTADMALVGNTGDAVGTGDLNFISQVGADQDGDIVFVNLAGDNILRDTSDTAITVKNSTADIILVGFGTHTLTAYVDNDDNGVLSGGDTEVFNIELLPGSDEYTITMSQELDDGSGLDFSDLSGVASGKNDFFNVEGADLGVGTPDFDLIITAVDLSGVNTSNALPGGAVGVGAQNIVPGEGVRLDFVDDASGNEKQLANLLYNTHTMINGASFQIAQFQKGTAADVTVTIWDVDDKFGTDFANDAQETEVPVEISAIKVNGVIVWDNVTGDLDLGDTLTFTVAGGSNIAEIHGLIEGSTIQVFGVTDYDRIEIENTSTETKFDIGTFETGSITLGDPLIMDFDMTVTDEDLDTAAGSLTVTSVPDGGANIVGTVDDETLIGGSTPDTLTGNGGADNLTGGAGIDTFVYAAGDGGGTVDLADVITDFEDNVDIIDLTSFTLVGGVGDARLSLTDDGNHTTIAVDGESLAVVTNILTADLADDIVT